jgi:hypothetical protein
MTDWSTFWLTFDWAGFWTNILAEIIFFMLGILVSILVIPRLTIRYITRRGRKFLKKKISFIIHDLCEFITEMPIEFRTTDDTVAIFWEGRVQFVTLLRPNLFKKVSKELLINTLLKSFNGRQPDDSFRILMNEKDRLSKLKESLENIIGVHSLNFDDKIIIDVSDLCFEIRKYEHSFKNNYLWDDLNAERKGVFGTRELQKIYDLIIDIIKGLVTTNDYLVEESKNE